MGGLDWDKAKRRPVTVRPLSRGQRQYLRDLGVPDDFMPDSFDDGHILITSLLASRPVGGQRPAPPKGRGRVGRPSGRASGRP